MTNYWAFIIFSLHVLHKVDLFEKSAWPLASFIIQVLLSSGQWAYLKYV